MLFNSYLFVFAVLPVTIAGFYLLRRQALRIAFLVAASYTFYGWAAWWMPFLMLGTTAIAFTAGLAVATLEGRRRQLALAGGIAGVLSLLLVFKYAGFASYYVDKLLRGLTSSGIPSILHFAQGIALPIGISFFTFEAISYLVDVHRGTVPAERNPLRFLFFISFFPHLIAGPIVRYGKLSPQLRVLYRFDADMFRSGLMLFSLGLAKKVLLADGIAQHIDKPFVEPGNISALSAWTGMIGYAFQIYFDFSGYTDMALGLARLFGIDLPWNFDRPYLAASPLEFWHRWHVTLSTWLRDYLYIPLGGNRQGAFRRDANLFATMALGGLWHGASLNFLLWGIYQGVLLIAAHRLRSLGLRFWRPLGVALTFALVTVGWVLFRFKASADWKHMLAGMAGRHGLGGPIPGLTPFLVVSALVVWGVPEPWSLNLGNWGPVRVALIGALVAIVLVAMNETSTFIYFRF